MTPDPVVAAAETAAKSEVAAKVSFFVSNPKATAIGSFVLGVLLTTAAFTFL